MSKSAVTAWLLCFFLDIGEHGNALRAQALAVTQQRSGIGIHIPFIGQVAKDHGLGPDEVEPGCVGYGQGLLVGPGQDLQAQGHFGMGAPQGIGQNRHGSHHRRVYLALFIGPVVHVFQTEGIHPVLYQERRFCQDLIADAGNRQNTFGTAGQSRRMDHGHQQGPPFGALQQTLCKGRHGHIGQRR